tara:strand:+ start:266 stop:484 length:219 start_codon:yes stop_codon:yes gene_type:complete
MILIKDDEMKKGYQLVGNVLFCAVIFKDGSIDSESWYPITDMTLYHQDMSEKLRGLAGTVKGLNAPLADDGL